MLTNYFKVNVGSVDEYLSHYSVSIFYEDGRLVNGKGVGRKVIDRVHETCTSDRDGKDFAYDGEKVYLLLVLFQGTSLSLLLYLRMLHLTKTTRMQALIVMTV